MIENSNDINMWSKEALHTKAIRYFEQMLSVHDRNDWQFGFWSSLALEMIAKAALANISPALIADGKDWNNVAYALGKGSDTKNLKSIDISEVFKRLKQLLTPEKFTMIEFCVIHINKRNSELHSGDLPFDDLKVSEWLSKYYVAISELLLSYNETLESTLGIDEAKCANTFIQAYRDDTKNAVLASIAAYKTVWNNKSDEEKNILREQARIVSTRQRGHRVDCPSCKCVALLHGNATGSPNLKIEDELIIEKQEILPESFECIACGLKISGYSKLSACGLGQTFIATASYEPTEYFNIETEHNSFEDDFNEY
jgi:hypothetical protein